jgi:Xaa-Pro dipeptidase
MAAVSEAERAASLVAAEEKAEELFAEVARRELVRPGAQESAVSRAVRDLGAELFGTDKHWHKRIVRSGPNTLAPYRENPPDRTIEADDIVFLDFGPIFAEWEADFGRTFVLGDDPHKLAVRDALPRVWQAGRNYFDSHPDVTGAELYDHVVDVAKAEGFEFGSPIAGHLLGEFPHKKIVGTDAQWYVTPGSNKPMRRTDPQGRVCHWILEIHLTDSARRIGGFYEQLLDLV